LASNLNPRLIHHEASNTTNRKAIVQTTETLNPTPNRDVAPRTEILKASRHSSETQPLKVQIDRVEHHNARSPLTFDWTKHRASKRT
jgi:hypothetical protein